MTDAKPNSYHAQPVGLFSGSVAMLTVMLWGATAVANQFALDVFPPIFIGGVRFLLASVFMLFWCYFSREQFTIKRKLWKHPFIMGVFLVLQIVTFNIGVDASSSSHGIILVNSFVFWVAAYEHFIQRSIRLSVPQFTGLLLAGGGCLLLLLGTQTPENSTGLDTPTLYGDAILLLSGFILSLKILYTKKSVQHVEPGPLIFWHDIAGTVMFFAWSLSIETVHLRQATWVATGSLLFAGFVISGFCFVGNAWLLKKHGASQISVFSFATPLFGIVLSVLTRGDDVSLWLIISGVCVALGIFLVNMPKRT